MLNLKDSSLFKTQSFIGNSWIKSMSGNTFDVINPADGSFIGTCESVDLSQVRIAINAAEQSLQAWSKKTAAQRANFLRRWFDLVMENAEDLALIMTTEQGKPLAEAKAEITYGAKYIEWFSEEAKRIYGDVIPSHGVDKRLITIKQPVGVVAAITPWNFPTAMITRKIAPALAAGCTVVLKPASETPYSALALAELAHRAGIPKGVINIVTGDSRTIGAELTSNPVIRKLTFTGSTPVGKKLIEQCASTVKKTSMELGGNAPLIVFDDADIDKAIDGIIASKFRNAGQTCVCANRIFVQDGIYDTLVEKLKARVSSFVVGNGINPEVNIGPLISEKAINTISSLVDDALSKGAKAVLGGNQNELKGFYFNPTILTDVNDTMRVFSEEIFGPIAPIFRFEDEKEVIKRANDTEFGLAAYLFTQNYSRIWRVSESLEYGIVGINEGLISTEVAPFGGVKESGQGREGSKYGIEDYLEIKYLCMGGIEKE